MHKISCPVFMDIAHDRYRAKQYKRYHPPKFHELGHVYLSLSEIATVHNPNNQKELY